MDLHKDKSFSKIVLVAIYLVMAGVALLHPPGNILSWDVFGHYLYLPALFIYNDLGLKETGFVQNILAEYNNSSTFYQVVLSPTGSTLIKYSSGSAILFLPFFFLGHIIALVTGAPADGFSLPYQYSIFGGCLVYSMIGLYFLRKVLKEFFPDLVVAITLLLVFLGTNYFSESVYKGAMSHNLLFTLYAVILWLTIRWHKYFRTGDAILLGSALGLASMIRPTDIVSLLIPAFWGIYNVKTLAAKANDVWRHKWQVILMGLFFLLAWSPQMLYWKTYTGQFMYYSYDNPGEGLDLMSPYTLQVLFSFRKGWFIYTPLMAFAVVGLIAVYRKQKPIFLAVLLYFIFNLYLVSSWSCWWYAESFGHRALVQSYPVMSLALGSLVAVIFERGRIVRAVATIAALFFIALNLFQNWQINHGILHGSRMTKDYYLATFGKTRTNDDLKKLLLVERPSVNDEFFMATQGYLPPRQLSFVDFESPETAAKYRLTDSVAYSGKYSLVMDPQQLYSPGFNIAFRDLTQKDHAWIRASAWIYPVSELEEEMPLMVMTFAHETKYYKYRTGSFESRGMDWIPGQWNLLTVDYITPEVRSKEDVLSVYLWFRGQGKVFVDNILVEVIQPEK